MSSDAPTAFFSYCRADSELALTRGDTVYLRRATEIARNATNKKNPAGVSTRILPRQQKVFQLHQPF